MKIFFILVYSIFATITLYAQNYQIRFIGAGQSSTVGTVKVENITQNKTITLGGTEVLLLTSWPTGINPNLEFSGNSFRIYPNPNNGSSTLENTAPTPGEMVIELFDINGKIVFSSKNYLDVGTHLYQVSGLQTGLFVLKIRSEKYSYSGKLLSNNTANAGIKIIPKHSLAPTNLKNATIEKQMQYSKGDRLKFTGTSGNCSTVITDVPISSKTMTFNFMACTDVDGNNYPVVQIGTQIWMAVNLKTTKFNDKQSIPLVTDGNTWTFLKTPGYCWYRNDLQNKDTYGGLYNWYSVNTGKLAPIGWHVPTSQELFTLKNYLGGYDLAGGPLKETGLTHWLTNGFASNSSGFTGLPGGYRNNAYNGASFSGIGNVAFWWTSTYVDGNSGYAHYYSVAYHDNRFSISDSQFAEGYSVRCIKD